MDMEHTQGVEESLRTELDKRTEGLRSAVRGLEEQRAGVQVSASANSQGGMGITL